jgi:3-hydroxyisobutyrate dehydrogenase
MGGPMCHRLIAAGFQLTVFDKDPHTVARLAAHGAVTPAATAADLALSDLIVTMLPDGRVVRDVVVDSGLLASLQPGTVIIDSGSSAPSDTVGLGQSAAEHRIDIIDAPVSGSPTNAGNGTLTLMAGGHPAAISRAHPVLNALGEVHHVGTLGAGHALKGLNNLLSSINLAAAAEIMLGGARYGIDPAAMLRVINRSTGRNDATERKFGPYVLSGNYASGFALELMEKDIRIATDLMHTLGVPAEFGATCRAFWEAAHKELGEGRDNTEVVRWLEARVGIELRPRT